MITFLCFLIPVVIVIVIICYSEDPELSPLGILIGGFIGLFVWLIVGAIIEVNVGSHYELVSNNEIYALRDNNGIVGDFFLGSGSINSNMKYFYIIKDDDGMKIQSIDVEDVGLNYDKNPRIENYEERFNNKFWQDNFPCPHSTKTKIFIPEGTIKYNFNVDLK